MYPLSHDGQTAHVGPSRAVAVLTGPARTFSRDTNQEIQWLPTTISIKCGEPRCACHASWKKKPKSCPALEGQVNLSGDTQYVRALGKIFEAGGQPVKNREMRSMAQRGNQAKFFHRMPGIQRSPVTYVLQHLREYNSCRIWASQSRRPPYMADVEGRARIEAVAALINESYLDAHGNKMAEDAVFKTPCVVIIFDKAPRYREVQSKPESKHLIMKAYRDRASSQAETWEETRPRTRSAVARLGRS